MDNAKATRIADQLLRLPSRSESQLAPAAAQLLGSPREPVRQHFQRKLVASAVPFVSSAEDILLADVWVELTDMQRALSATMLLVTPAMLVEVKIAAKRQRDPAYTIGDATSTATAWRHADVETIEYSDVDTPSAEDADEPWATDGVLKVVLRSNRFFRFYDHERNAKSIADVGVLLMS